MQFHMMRLLDVLGKIAWVRSDFLIQGKITDFLIRGEFNNASARRALVDRYLSLFIMCKAGHQYNERPRALALLNLPLVCKKILFPV